MKNLTGQSPAGHDTSYQSLSGDVFADDLDSPPQNPFASETNSVASYDHISDNSSSSHDLGYNRTRAVGQGYATTSNSAVGSGNRQSAYNLDIPSRQSSGGSLSAMGTSAPYDRYPHRISSAAPSVASGAALLPNGRSPFRDSANGSAKSGSSISSGEYEKSSQTDPFISSADFSPFGGYPVSSFPLHLDEKEADDYIHNPDPILDAKYDRRCTGSWDRRGFFNLLALFLLVAGAIMVFIILPVLTYSGVSVQRPATHLIEVLSPYSYSTLSAIRTNLVDDDTPDDAKTRTALDGSSWDLVFSDEFAKEGRTFYDGDDQFFLAPDIWYGATQDLEWYSPDAVHTENGTLQLRLDAFKNHGLLYRSGMVQSWNKLCFTQGMLEVSAMLPGSGDAMGLWPGIWTLGNLARAGYKASSEGTWPYSYNDCDAGITANQSSLDGISYLPGQRLASCVCPGHDHPNVGTGRGAPEIDAIEGAIGGTTNSNYNGVASQSLQTAPFDIWYMPNYDFLQVYNKSITSMNTYAGGPFQQAISGTTSLNHDWYERGGQKYQSYGFEYLNDDTDGYIRWFVGHNPTYMIRAPALGANGNVGQRQIPKEPLSIIMNLGLSNSWAYIDWNALHWPSIMRIDYVRIYQPAGSQSITCDPTDYPTYDYINDHLNAYTDPNVTSWEEAGYSFPPNKLLGGC